MVQLLERHRASTAHDKVLARAPRHPARLHARATSASCRPARRSTRPPPRSSPSATASSASTCELLDGDDRVRLRGQARARPGPCSTYVENHNFYVEHWGHQRVLAQDPRAVGGVLQARASGPTPTTSSCCAATRSTTRSCDMVSDWAAGAARRPARATGPPRSSAAAGILDALRRAARRRRSARRPTSSPSPSPSCSGASPSESIQKWLGGMSSTEGALGLRRLARGRRGPRPRAHQRRPARRGAGRRDPRRPAHRAIWAPIFGASPATVTDIGGMMSHAAIVCREYGLPAVTGTAFATRTDQDRPARQGGREQRYGHDP